MNRIVNYIKRKPIDIRVFISSFFLIFGVFFFPEEPKNITVLSTYLVFVFVSMAFSGFYMTYVSDSQYNFFRKPTNFKGKLTTISIYIIVCVILSYILATTGWFLFLIG